MRSVECIATSYLELCDSFGVAQAATGGMRLRFTGESHASAVSVLLPIVFRLRAIRIMTTYGSTIHYAVGEATVAVTQRKPYDE